MTNSFQQYDSKTIRFAGGLDLPTTQVLAMRKEQIADLSARGGDFLTNARMLFGRHTALDRIADLAVLMLEHPDPQVPAAGERGLLQLAAAGSNCARFNLAVQYVTGQLPDPDFERAIELLKGVAETEWVDPYLKGLAIKTLADCYLEGRGVVANTTKAYQLYEQATDYDVAEAAFNVGLFHDDKTFERHHGPVNYVKAAAFYERSAELGHVPAMTNLGLLYVGEHVAEPEPDYGWKLLARASQLGDQVAENAIATLFTYGIFPKGRSALHALARGRQ